jgi:DNA-binding transcriptional regulator YhcF (GntR family)
MTTEKVVEILKAHGTIVSMDEAKTIVAYLTELAKLEVDEFIKYQKENKFSPSEEKIISG